MYYADVPTPNDEYNHYVLQTYTKNKNLKIDNSNKHRLQRNQTSQQVFWSNLHEWWEIQPKM